ncbi:hypothetical protein PVAND_007266 [Polypedilum vanderplanki]|uniref:Uncharacterized protein n=1 Tax=Polypedilum vanderplanki TaxID=319348 RepID=A0A9J6C7A6_POLVA|nr:hypothetical protein PVAND_007266 [Polypedilum vanderplanki]
MKFIKIFTPYLSEIILDCVGIKEILDVVFEETEKIKFISIISYRSFDCINIFSKCKSLRKLIVKTRHVNVFMSGYYPMKLEYMDQIVKLLYQNTKLKYLGMSFEMYYQILKDQDIVSKIPFKLALFVNISWMKMHYKNFFRTQINNIQTLTLHRIDYSEDLVTIFKMNNLKNVCLGRSEDLNLKNIELTVNTNLQSLAFFDAFSKIKKAQTLINVAPNIQDLTIFWLTQEIMEHVAVKLKKLKTLTMYKYKPGILNPSHFPIRRDPIEKFLKNVNIIPFR